MALSQNLSSQSNNKESEENPNELEKNKELEEAQEKIKEELKQISQEKLDPESIPQGELSLEEALNSGYNEGLWIYRNDEKVTMDFPVGEQKEFPTGKAFATIFNSAAKSDLGTKKYLDQFFKNPSVQKDPLFYAYSLYEAMDGSGIWSNTLEFTLDKAIENGVLGETFDKFGTIDGQNLIEWVVGQHILIRKTDEKFEGNRKPMINMLSKFTKDERTRKELKSYLSKYDIDNSLYDEIIESEGENY